MPTRSLAFVGCNIGADVDREVDAHDAIWLFEPIPEVAAALLERYIDYRGKAIKIVNAACWSDSEPRRFHLYNRNGLSSSLGTVTQQAAEFFSAHDLDLLDSLWVRCTVLSEYLPIHLTKLIIDAQGADLAILKTVEPWLESGRIETIKVECDGPGFQHYNGIGDNSQDSLLEYMGQFPYIAERVAQRRAEHPDWVFRVI